MVVQWVKSNDFSFLLAWTRLIQQVTRKIWDFTLTFAPRGWSVGTLLEGKFTVYAHLQYTIVEPCDAHQHLYFLYFEVFRTWSNAINNHNLNSFVILHALFRTTDSSISLTRPFESLDAHYQQNILSQNLSSLSPSLPSAVTSAETDL